LDDADEDEISRWLGAYNGAASIASRPRADMPVPDKAKTQVGAKLVAKLRGAHALAVSDYGFGAASPQT